MSRHAERVRVDSAATGRSSVDCSMSVSPDAHRFVRLVHQPM